MPVYLTVVGYLSSDIIGGTCIPWGAYNNYATSFMMVISYLLPLMTMLFCYTRIVYKLKIKVHVTHTLQ